MPTLEFKGKASVYSHHLSVPFRELSVEKNKSLPAPGEKPSLDDNLIIQGDNLEALKALLPRYAGKVDVIYIDPPYNTGNEGWAYNDNVNSPLMKQWLGKTIDADDLERHDKWLCMMWPRLSLLRELVHDDGVILIHIDEHELHNLISVGEEVLSTNGFSFLGQIVWNKLNPKGDATSVAYQHESVLAWGRKRQNDEIPLLRKQKPNAARMLQTAKSFWQIDPDTAAQKYSEWVGQQEDLSGGEKPYSRIDRKGRVYRLVHMGWPNKKKAPDEYFQPLKHPISGEKCPMPDRGWRYPPQTFGEMQMGDVAEEPDGTITKGIINFPRDNGTQPQRKYFLDDNQFEAVPSVIEFGGSDESFFSELGLSFENPKPHRFAKLVLSWAAKPDAIILDSFAGSGTTGHATLALNAEDAGRRKFLLVQLPETTPEGSAARAAGLQNLAEMAAERVRRVIKGVPGAKNEALKKGLGGSFTYCELGEPLDLERFFEGKATPPYSQVARYIVYTATGRSIEAVPEQPDDLWFVGEAGGYRIHLIYKPDLAWMKSDQAALIAELADKIAEAAGNKPALVYAAQKFMSQKALLPKGVTFCQLPYSIYRILGDGSDAA